MPLGELYQFTGEWDGVREALGITMCTLSSKEKCKKILREHSEKQAMMQANVRFQLKGTARKMRIVRP